MNECCEFCAGRHKGVLFPVCKNPDCQCHQPPVEPLKEDEHIHDDDCWTVPGKCMLAPEPPKTEVKWEEEIRKIAQYLGANEDESVSEYGKLLAQARREGENAGSVKALEWVARCSPTSEEVIRELNKDRLAQLNKNTT